MKLLKTKEKREINTLDKYFNINVIKKIIWFISNGR